MIYKFNNRKRKYESITKKIILWCTFFIISISGTISYYIFDRIDNVKYITEETKTIIINQNLQTNKFSKQKLKEYILQLNIKFPYIVMAQAELETGNFKSLIFKENNNLFGFKVATRRPTTNQGSENGHAVFNTWKESVLDYAFYSAAYLNDIRTESEYLDYLKANYAEDPDYITKVKQKILKLKNSF